MNTYKQSPMKKILLILALLAYAAVSCDKPETTSVDEPETIDTSADTCKIYIYTRDLVAMLYNVSVDDVNFDFSILSVFKHFTITLNDGSLPTPIIKNCAFYRGSTVDSGSVMYHGFEVLIDSLKYGKYIIALWDGLTWGPNFYNQNQKFLYREIVLDEQKAFDSVFYGIGKLDSILNSIAPLSFQKL